ncbi:MAG: hypothetical protein ACI9TB_002495 [Parasphingorhabdus sp.]|jgi:hypothetical protein|uniref:hypothetical protein n=1 Tax=Parasphingorhabdus sp. TaxID=2709688 RepID=UPI0039E4B6B6
MKEKNKAVVRGGDGRERVFSSDLNGIAYLAMSGSSNYAAPYPVEAIVKLLRSDEPICPEVRNLMAELFDRGMNAQPDSEDHLLSIKLHNHGGKDNPSRMAITAEERLELFDIYEKAKANPAIRSAAAYMRKNHGISSDVLREVRKVGNDFEKWYSKEVDFDRKLAQVIFANNQARGKL